MVDSVDEVVHHELREPGHMDITEQVKTWHLFIRLTKITLAITAVILILLAAFVV
jgi:hypothetical protein